MSMLRVLPSLLAPLIAVAVSSLPRVALAEPTVGIVVLSHEGLTDDQADEIAAEVGTAVQNRIEGTAKSGATVRERLPAGGAEEGCEEKPDCGRALAKTLASDETLLLVLQKEPHRIVMHLHRVPRDPARAPTHAATHLMGTKLHHAHVITESIAALYAPGSVVAWVEPSAVAAPAVAPAAVVAEEPVAVAVAPAAQKQPVYKKGWFIGVMAGVGALVVAGVVVGIVLGIPPSPTGAPITLP